MREPIRPCPPIIDRHGLYMLEDIRKVLGVSSRQLASWKQDPTFNAIRLPGGDAIYGDDLIQWLRVNRAKYNSGGERQALPDNDTEGPQIG